MGSLISEELIVGRGKAHVQISRFETEIRSKSVLLSTAYGVALTGDRDREGTETRDEKGERDKVGAS